MNEPYMPLRLAIHDDPDVISFANICGCSVNEAVGAITRVWAWANRHLSDGVAHGVTLDDIDRISALRNAGRALIAVGYLRQKEDTDGSARDAICFTRFGKWNAQGLKARTLAAERQRRYRERHRNVTRDVTSNADVDGPAVNVIHTSSTSSLLSRRTDETKMVAMECLSASGVTDVAAAAIYRQWWSLPADEWRRGQAVAQSRGSTIRDVAAWWVWWLREGRAVVNG